MGRIDDMNHKPRTEPAPALYLNYPQNLTLGLNSNASSYALMMILVPVVTSARHYETSLFLA